MQLLVNGHNRTSAISQIAEEMDGTSSILMLALCAALILLICFVVMALKWANNREPGPTTTSSGQPTEGCQIRLRHHIRAVLSRAQRYLDDLETNGAMPPSHDSNTEQTVQHPQKTPSVPSGVPPSYEEAITQTK